MSATIDVALGRATLRLHRRTIVVGVVLVAIVAAGAIVGLMLGSAGLDPRLVVETLIGGGDARSRLVVGWRAPRAVAAVMLGALLAIGGAIFQSLTRNPLGSPDVIGLTTGSYTGVVAVLLAGGTSAAALAAGSLVGGLATACAVYLLAFRRGVQGFRLIVVGIAVSAMLSSVTAWFSVKADVDLALRAAVWGAGSLADVGWDELAIAAAMLGIVAAAAPVLRHRLVALDLGDDVAASLGVRVERAKLLAIVVGIAATAVATAAAGPIAFIALAAPQIARRLTRSSSLGLGRSALVGSALLALADLVAQHALPSIALPTGAVTVCLGGGYLVWLLMRETRNETRRTA